jgi:hypothetical protein
MNGPLPSRPSARLASPLAGVLPARGVIELAEVGA